MVRAYGLVKGAHYQHFFHKHIIYEYVEKEKLLFVFRVIGHKDALAIGEKRLLAREGLRLLQAINPLTNEEALIYLKTEKMLSQTK